MNWPGSGFDPETATFYTMASNTNVTAGKYYEEEFDEVRADHFNAQNPRKPRWEADPNYGLRGTNQPGGAPPPAPNPAQAAAAAANPAVTGRQALVAGLDGLQITKPPYGVIAGIDLNQNGKLIFTVPHGETPDNVRNHPLLRGMNIPKTGQGTSVGIMVTKTMLVAGESQITAPQGRARGARLVAYDKKDGHENRLCGDAGGNLRLADDLLGQRPPGTSSSPSAAATTRAITSPTPCRSPNCRARATNALDSRRAQGSGRWLWAPDSRPAGEHPRRAFHYPPTSPRRSRGASL
ncbi:MAG: hypothetical protein QM736_17680 [Vicinamibacterales bacterium]